MASIPGFLFNVTGASGTQGLLAPQGSWRAYILPRGAHASQSSTGTLITFDTAAAASRFAANDWIQAGLATANIRQVSAVGGNSMSVGGAALTIAENDRIFLIGRTQPTVSGGSATYTTPATSVYQRDDDTSDLFTNSMITSNSDGLVQGWAAANFYDVIVQDGNQANQGSIIDLAVGAVEGISVSGNVVIGGTLTVHGSFGVTGGANFGSSVTMNAILAVDSTAAFGVTVTVHGALGVTRTGIFGQTLTANAGFGVTGHAVFGATATFNSQIGVTGHAVFGATVTANGALGVTGAAVFGATATLNGNAVFGATTSYASNFILPAAVAVSSSTTITWPAGMFFRLQGTSTCTTFTAQSGRLIFVIGESGTTTLASTGNIRVTGANTGFNAEEFFVGVCSGNTWYVTANA